jgi:L-alanine-DL-glutamate epimerase-like enolase superfamily enzyme
MKRITRIQVQRFDVLLDEPYTVAYGTFDRELGYLVTLTDSDGNVGIGLGTPCDEAHDSPQVAMDGLSNIAFKESPACDSPAAFYDRHLRDIKSPAVRCGFDIAMWDLAGKQRGTPTYNLFAQTKYRAKPNSVTVCIKPTLQATAEEARQIIQNYPHIKLMKIKLNGEGDVERCRAIRDVVPSGLGYILDANQAYTDPDLGFRVMKEIRDTLGEIVVIEQPTPREDIEALARITKLVNFSRVYADESCVGEADVQAIIAREAAHGVNIKLQKAGGITPALAMLAVVERHNLTAMLGCMMELPIAVAAAAHLSVVHDSVIVTDLDSDLALFSVGKTSLGFSEGARTIQDVAGLGCSVDEHLAVEAEKRGRLARESVLDISF